MAEVECREVVWRDREVVAGGVGAGEGSIGCRRGEGSIASPIGGSMAEVCV